MENAIKGMSIDTGKGLDQVSMKSVKKLKTTKVIGLIATIMQKWNIVPTSFRKAHTILIYKRKVIRKTFEIGVHYLYVRYYEE